MSERDDKAKELLNEHPDFKLVYDLGRREALAAHNAEINAVLDAVEKEMNDPWDYKVSAAIAAIRERVQGGKG